MKTYFNIANIIFAITAVINLIKLILFFVPHINNEPISNTETFLNFTTNLGFSIAFILYAVTVWFILKNFVDGKYNKDSYIININLTEKENNDESKSN